MLGPQRITASDLRTLSHDNFRALGNLLIQEDLRGSRARHRPADRNTVADNGVDHLVEEADGGLHVPRGNSAWQFKSGNAPTLAVAKQEVDKPGVQSSLSRGYTYVLACAADMEPIRQQTLENDLLQHVRVAHPTGAVRVVAGSAVASWADDVPQARALLGHSLPTPLLAEEADRPQHKNIPFATDDRLNQVVAQVTSFVQHPNPGQFHLRIEGPPGSGKTRTVIEGCRQELERVFLASEDTWRDLAQWLRDRPSTVCTVVVDDVSYESSLSISDDVDRFAGRVRLISIGHSSSSSGRVSILRLPVMLQNLIERIVSARFPELQSQQVAYCAATARGYVRMALLVAGQLHADPDLSILFLSQMLRSDLAGLFPDTNRTLLRVLSLFSRVGWKAPPISNEGEYLCRFFQIDWISALETAEDLRERGILQYQGRYVYITPEVLAIGLAAEAARTWGGEFEKLWSSLPTEELRRAFLDRLASLRGQQEASSFAESFFRSGRGPLKLEDLDSSESMRLFVAIARVDPIRSLGQLEELLSRTSDEQLRHFSRGRRELIWLLEETVQERVTFARSAGALFRLATSENEDLGNNATEVWSSLFLPRLGETEASLPERVELLRLLLAGVDATFRGKLVILSALSKALEDHEVGRPYAASGSRVPAKWWTPKTFGEVWSYQEFALSVLDHLMQDQDERVSAAARRCFIESFVSVARWSNLDAVVHRLQAFEPRGYSEWSKAWEEAARLLGLLQEPAAPKHHLEQVKAEVARLEPKSFPDRLRRYVGTLSWPDYQRLGEDSHQRQEALAAALADEALDGLAELTAADLGWLMGHEASYAYAFGRQLGARDLTGRLVAAVAAAAANLPGPPAAASYFAGLASHSGWRTLAPALDAMATDERLAATALAATVLNERPETSDYARVLSVLERGWGHPFDVAYRARGRWVEDMPASTFARLVRAMLRHNGWRAESGALHLANRWLGSRQGSVPKAALPVLWQLVERPTEGGNGSAEFEWAQVAQRLLGVNPNRVIRAVLAGTHEMSLSRRDERMATLLHTAESHPKETWEAFAGATRRGLSGSLRLGWWAQSADFATHFEPDLLLGWMRAAPAKRAKLLARVIKPCEIVSPLVRGLLDDFGAESDVATILAANFGTGVFSGPESSHEESQLGIVRGWLKDSSPAVRAWAGHLAGAIERRIPSIKIREDEEGF